MFGLDPKSVAVGVVLGAIVAPRVISLVVSRTARNS